MTTDRELAWYVLRQFGDRRWPRPGSFYESLVDTIARADPTNTALLALGFPRLVAMVDTAQNDPEGMASLVGISEGTAESATLPSITCPVCQMTSHNPDDVREGYCGNCLDWTTPR